MDLKELYQRTRTIRKYKEEPIDKKEIYQIIDSARIASCANNKQNLRYIIVSSEAKRHALQSLIKWAAALPNGIGTPKDDEYPPVYLIIVQTKPSGFSDVDAGIAADRIMTTAAYLGLGSIIFGSHNPAKVGELFNLNEGEKARLVVGIGKPAIKSEIVAMKDNDTAYYVDDDFNYYVPKRALEDIIEEQ